MIEETTLAYIAGIIDGEGTVTFDSSRGYDDAVGTIRLSIVSTTSELIEWLEVVAGGKARLQPEWTKAGNPARLGSKPCWAWRATGERAAIILRATFPWLIIKKARTQEALRLWEGSYFRMRRPGRRDFHANRDRADLALRGWPEELTASTLPFEFDETPS